MFDQPDDLLLVHMRALREALAKLERDHASLVERFDAIRHAVNGESFLGRMAAADIEQQLLAINERLASLEGPAEPRS